MGSDDLFKKRREERKKRKHEYRPVNTNSFLIVTEGERTEPLYFKGIQKKIKEKRNGRIDVIENPIIDIYGEGCSTGKLIEVTEQIVKDAKRRMSAFVEKRDVPSRFDPGTTVFKLVEELKGYLDE